MPLDSVDALLRFHFRIVYHIVCCVFVIIYNRICITSCVHSSIPTLYHFLSIIVHVFNLTFLRAKCGSGVFFDSLLESYAFAFAFVYRSVDNRAV